MGDKGIYQIDVPRIFIPLTQDLIKLFVIWAIYYLMIFSRGDKSASISVAVEQLIYAVLGLATYWLILKRIFDLKPKIT